MAEVSIFALDADLSEEENEDIAGHHAPKAAPAVVHTAVSEVRPETASYEFSAASQQLEVDPWNVDAWLQFVHQADLGLSGSVTLVQAYEKFVAQFPGAANFWHKLALLHFNARDMPAVDAVLTRCLSWCADVDLWLFYVRKVEVVAFNRQGIHITPQHDLYLKARHEVVDAFEFAIENVGMAIDSDVLWTAYIQFISSWPDSDSSKVVALRKAFQRAITVPCNGIDVLWSDYETFERRTSEQLAASMIPDMQPKYQAAKAVYKDRKRLYAAVDLNQFATPASNNRTELRQLHAWKSLLQAEQKNPSVLSENEHKACMRHTFLLALRCMRFYPELWIYYAEHEISSGDVHAAKVVLKNALEVLPDCGMIRVFFAELEEKLDNLVGAKNILTSYFDAFPSALSFNIVERFLWRTEGKIAARRFFSNTLRLRKNGKLSFHVYITHGLLELEANREPEVALRVFDLACMNNPECRADPTFIKAQGRVLIQLGKLDDLRAKYETAIEQLPPKVALQLTDELIDLEEQLLMSNPKRFDELLQRRKRLVAESERKPTGRDTTLVQQDPFESTRIRARYWQALGVPPQTSSDSELLERITATDAPAAEATAEAPSGGRGGDKASNDTPPAIRDLIHKLPTYMGPPPDIDTLLKQLKIMPLPPRPIAPGTTTAAAIGRQKRKSDDLRDGGKDSDDEDWAQDGFDSTTDVFRQRQMLRQMQHGVEALLR